MPSCDAYEYHFFYLTVKQDKNTLIQIFLQCINMWKLHKKTVCVCSVSCNIFVFNVHYHLLAVGKCFVAFPEFLGYLLYWPRTSRIQVPVFGMDAICLSNMVCYNVVICSYLVAPRGVDDLSRLLCETACGESCASLQ